MKSATRTCLEIWTLFAELASYLSNPVTCRNDMLKGRHSKHSKPLGFSRKLKATKLVSAADFH